MAPPGSGRRLRQVYPGARGQRRWARETGNLLNKLPKGPQKKARQHLQDIWMAETIKDAEKSFGFFLAAHGPKCDRATARLAKDRDALLSFHDFPAMRYIVNLRALGLNIRRCAAIAP